MLDHLKPFSVKYIGRRVARWAVFLPNWVGFKVGLRFLRVAVWAVLGGFAYWEIFRFFPWFCYIYGVVLCCFNLKPPRFLHLILALQSGYYVESSSIALFISPK